MSDAEAKRKIGRLVLWGAKFGDPLNPFSFNPPTPAEMMAMALLILERQADGWSVTAMHPSERAWQELAERKGQAPHSKDE